MLAATKRLFRLIYINYILLKHGLDEIALSTGIFKPLKLLMVFNPMRRNNHKNIPRGIRIREACEELGPIFVKCGQLLSTRVDLLPDDIAKELAKLQDKVPPFASEQAIAIIEKSLQQPIDQLFKDFETVPLASASISQVHAATLLNGQQVAIKVLRPNIKQKITHDIELICAVAKLVQKYSESAKRFKIYEIALELKKSITEELDLMREAANASQLRRNFANSRLLYIPQIYWPYTKKNILVLERIYGIQVSNINVLKKANTDLKLLAERGVEIFFTQVFRDCFFHADMHPGNVWVSIDNPKDPKFMALDFGIVGTLGPADQRYLAENFLAFFKRDYRRVAELHIESGWIPKDTRINEFESAIRCVCEPIFGMPLKDISFGKTLLRLFQTARQFKMEIQPQLILLQKTLIAVEGLGRQLYPELDIWHAAKPFLEKWMRSRVGARALFNKIRNYGPFWLERLPDVPDMLYSLLENQQQHDNIKKHNAILQQDDISKGIKNTSFFSSYNVAWFTLGCLAGYAVFRYYLT